jgi:ABC-2 type transport system permease protein
VTKAFLFLLSRSFANRTKARLKRLKQPKYLIGAIFGVIYICAYLFPLLFSLGRPDNHWFDGRATIAGGIGAIVLFCLVLSAWIFPRQRTALVFSEAEIAFLFPAPITRRSLIHYKLLKSQVAIFFTVLLLTVITGGIFSSRVAWISVLGCWLILSTLNLHYLGASFARTMLLDRGISNWFRRTVVLLVFAALVIVTIVWASQTISPPPLGNFTDWTPWRNYIRSLIETAPLSYLLHPFHIVLGPYLAKSAPQFVQAFGPAVAIIALHYLWVIRSNVAFEEASLEVSRRFAERISAARQGKSSEARPAKGRRAPFRLPPLGFPSFAFLWKNLIRAQAAFRARTLIAVAIPIVIAAAVIGRGGERGGALIGTALILTSMGLGWSLFIGAQFVRCDFRQDLAAMDVLKLYPLRGWQIVAGEVLAPVTILTAVQWLLLVLLAAMVHLGSPALELRSRPLPWIGAAAILAPFWNALVLLIPNAAVLLFPGWFQTRVDAPHGIEVTGQRLLLLFGQLVVMGVTVVPAALAFTVGFVPLQLAGGDVIAPLTGAAAAALVLTGEILLGVWLVGKLFDRFDIAAEQGA